MIQFTERFILIDFLFVFDIIKCIKKEAKSEFMEVSIYIANIREL